jgi:hypothetical protein
MRDPTAQPIQQSRPALVVAAVGLLVADALLGAVSVHVLFALSPSSKGWVLPFQPGVWVFALLQVLVALLLLRGVTWLRYAVALLVVGSLLDQLLNTSLGARYQSFPLATARDGVSALLQLGAVVLLFLPRASAWFGKRKVLSAA